MTNDSAGTENKLTGLEIAVIGMAGRFPGAGSIHEFWENLKNGVESITFFSDEELAAAGMEPQLFNDSAYVKAVPLLEEKEYFDAFFFGYTPAEAEVLAPHVRIYHECTWAALEDAGYDPFSYQGQIACYAGSSSSFMWQAFSYLSGMDQNLGTWASHLLTEKDNLGTHLAYKLNLKGPSFTFFSACSTSLVAVHLACRALLTGECSMATAGGIALDTSGKPGYLYREGMIFSPDGHCRTFDADADATIFGEGAGVVILKRYRDAVKDRDHIYAVIKGSAVNNDGMGKVGYTAPGTHGQRDVVKQALKAAKVSAETITYVETHGTATALGDPMEMEALTEAFNIAAGKKQFCAVGSVKTNIGHLDAAAGIAGFIKTVLALKHRCIPPSLHFREANPRIDFQNSPFFVNTRLLEWKNEGGLLRAGVSSFGIGGTNAHVILEETPADGEYREKEGEREYRLLLLSAKTETALEIMTRNLAGFFKGNPSGNVLANAAYTLQVGRRQFRHRRMAVCVSAGEAAEMLSNSSDGRLKSFSVNENDPEPPVVFMFPGMGSEYVNMGRELYEKELLFRQEMDRCFDILTPLSNCDLKEMLYPDKSNRSYGTNEKKLEQPEIAQPLIFAVEYSLASLLNRWGIKPDAVVGYSFGEYVAACTAGVFSLEDALRLVVARGTLIQKTGPGLMVSIPLPLEEAVPLVDEFPGLAPAIDNGPTCIAAGPPGAVQDLEKKLKEKKILSMRVPLSHALHSPMMAAIAGEFREVAASITLNTPRVPYVSNVSGNWIRSDQAVDPGYWAAHLQQTVRFADGIKLLTNKWKDALFLEVGPGRDLSALVVRYIEEKPEHRVFNLLRHPQRDVPDVYFLLDKIGRLWNCGKKPDPQAFYTGEKRRRISLPTYPFDRHHYPAHGDPFALGARLFSGASLLDRLEKKTDIADWFYIPSWKRSMMPSPNITQSPSPLVHLILGDPRGLGAQLAEQLENRNAEVIKVREGEEFAHDGEFQYSIDPRNPAHYTTLLSEIHRRGKTPGKVIHLWNVTGSSGYTGEDGFGTFDNAQNYGLYSLLYLAKATGELDACSDFEFIVISDNIHEVTGKENLSPEKSTVLSPVKVIPQEFPYIVCRSIDIVLPEAESTDERKLIERLAVEISLPAGSVDTVIAYRDNHRWVQTFEPVRLEEIPGDTVIPRLKENGVYVITGGLGGLGLTLADYLARNYRARLVLTARSPLPPREEWDERLSLRDGNDGICRKIEKIKELEDVGAKVHVFGADVSDPDEMERVFATAEEHFGPVSGVIHAAGILGSGGASFNVVNKLDIPSIKEQFRAKVYGLYVLEKILRGRKPAFCLLTSSLSPILGGLGFTAYAAANQFMDTFAYKFNKNCGEHLWLSLNWGDWQPWTDEDREAMAGTTIGQLNMQPDEGIETFRRILYHCESSQVVVSSGNLQVRIDQWVRLKTLRDEEEKTAGQKSSSLSRRSHLSDGYVPPRNQLEQGLVTIWQRLFGFDRVGTRDDFFELGGDSLKAITLAARIHKELKVEIPLTEFFDRPTIEKLARYIEEGSVGDTYAPIEVVEKKEYYPLSSAQKRLYFVQQMDKNFSGYNEQMAFMLEGPLDKRKLEGAAVKFAARHESIRTSFLLIGDKPVQKIHDHVGIEIECFDSLPLAAHFIRPFDLSCAPLLRVGLVVLGERKHLLMFDMHHIIFDGTSMGILLDEIAKFYAGEELSPLTIQYKDFSTWQNRLSKCGKLKDQEFFWMSLYADARDISTLMLPSDFSRPRVMTFEGDVHEFMLEREYILQLKELAAENDVTLYMTLLAALNVLLYRYTGQEDIVVGSGVLGRSHADLQPVVGMFVNTLALRSRPTGEKNYAGFLNEVKTANIQAYRNQDFQFEDLVDRLNLERDSSRNPLFDVCFAFQNFEQPEVRLKETTASHYPLKNKSSRFDMTFFTWETEDGIIFNVEYYTRVYKEETIRQLGTHLLNIIKAVCRAPGIRLSDIDFLTGEETRRLLYLFNDTACNFPKEKTIHQLFEEQAIKSSDRTAVCWANRSDGHYLTYSELNRQSGFQASLLRKEGIDSDSIAAIMMERSVDMVIGILAILKAGGAYLPIDPEYPEDRVRYMLEDSGTKVVLKNSGINLNERTFAHIPVVLNFENLNFEFVSDFEFRASDFPSSNLAYVIYTSGTTGKPKGVLIDHRNVVRLMFNDKFRFDFGQRDVWTLFHSFCFDFSVWEMYGALLYGGRLVIVPPMTARDPREFLQVLKAYHVTVLNQTPSSFYNLIREESEREGKDLHLRYIIFGGEALAPGKLRQWKTKYPGTKLVNMFGITETCVHVTYKEIGEREVERDNSNIGKPIPTLTTYIMDRFQRLMPPGAAGELNVGGEGLARGYINRPELTAEKFIPNPYKPGDRLYRSGDLARTAANSEDGEMEYMGRIDHQVKIRGFRVELGEIRSEMLKHEAVKEAVVITKEIGGDTALCAYFISREDIALDSLRSFLGGKLPHYMIPAYFIPLDKIPLTANGKIDKNALPEPGMQAVGSGETYIAPSDEIEETLQKAWKEVLALEKPGIKDNFFNIGGDSIKTIRLINKINAAFNTNFGVADIYTHQTIESFAHRISGSEIRIHGGELNETAREIEELKNRVLEQLSIEVGEDTADIYPMSDIEKGMIYYTEKEPEKMFYHEQFAYQFKYPGFNQETFTNAVCLLMEKHPILKTSFNMTDFERPVHILRVQVPPDVSFFDISDREKILQETYIREFQAEDRKIPFKVSHAPLWRMRVFLLGNDEILLLWIFHHAILDGWSNASFITELNNTYLELGKNPAFIPPPLKSSHKDSIIEQETEKKKIHYIDYWKKELDDYKRVDFSGLQDRSTAGNTAEEKKRYVKRLDHDLLEKLEKTAKDLGTTIKNLCFGAFAFMMNMLSYDNDIVVGLVSNLRPACEDGDKLLGCFLNTLPVRIVFPHPCRWSEFIRLLDEKLVELKRYERISLIEIVSICGEKNRDGNPFFDAIFNFVDFHIFHQVETGVIADEWLNVEGYENTNTMFDFTVNKTFGSLHLFLMYSHRLVSDDAVRLMLRYFETALDKIASPHEQEAFIEKEHVFTDEERRKILYFFNDTAADIHENQTIHGIFETQAETTPFKTALVCGDETVTYGELDLRSESRAGLLGKKGVCSDTIVGIMAERSVEMILGILAILKAGGAYLPIDPGYPVERINYMLADSAACLLLTHRSLKENKGNIDFQKEIFYLEDDIPDPALSSRTGNASDLAYIIYTSGTTGKPKGILTMHYNVLRVVRDTNYIEITGNDRLLQLSNYAFDGSVFDIYSALLNGAALVMADRGDIAAADRLAEKISRELVTVFFVTTALFNQLIDLNIGCFRHIRKVLFGGERVSVEHAARALEYMCKGKIIHVYGPTETTVFATYYFIDEIANTAVTIPIGRPLTGTSVYILDRYLSPMPVGAAGEIYIGGSALARGYLNRPELTHESFIRSDRSYRTYISYKTGDLGRRAADGAVEFLDRIDRQVKIRGFRIELGEIEHRLLGLPDVKEVVVLDMKNGDKYLCAYIVSEQIINSGDIRSRLSKVLPEYMIPSYFIPLDRIPLTPNGKVDRKALPLPQLVIEDHYVPPENDTQEKLVNIWADLLNINRSDSFSIGIDSNFFEIGGHSLKASALVSRIHKEFNVKIPISELFSTPTIKGLSVFIEKAEKERYSTIEPVEKKDYYLLSSAQKRLYILQQKAPNSTVYNISLVIPLPGGTGIRELERTFVQLIKRHESLRTSFKLKDGRPVQQISDDMTFSIETGRSEGDFVRPFDLSKAPLMRVGMIKTGENAAVLAVEMHHIISDGASLQILERDFTELYHGWELSPLKIQYKDFAQWQNRERQKEYLKRQENYWIQRFEDGIPELKLPTDFPRPKEQRFEGASFSDEIYCDIDALKNAVLLHEVTLFMFFLALYNIFLSRVSGQEDIVVGTPAAGRNHDDLKEVMGMFVNTLILRNRPKQEKTFTGFLKEVKENTLNAINNQDYQFEDLVEKIAVNRDRQNPIFDVMFQVHEIDADGETGDEISPFKQTTAKFDLTLDIFIGRNLFFSFEYSTALFEEKTIRHFASIFKDIVLHVLSDQNINLKDIIITTAFSDSQFKNTEEELKNLEF